VKIFLAWDGSTYAFEKYRPPYILLSFEALGRRGREVFQKFREKAKIVMLDSGAFTFIHSKRNVSVSELDAYVEEYTKFIVDNDVQLFFEMDVDLITGYERVLEYRKFIEKVTRKKTIPVWHRTRGKEEWERLLNSGYKIVAIGGLAIKTINLRKELPYLNAMVKQAHEKGVLVHGLGTAAFTLLRKMLFDSVDASTWIINVYYGALLKVDIPNGTLKRITSRTFGLEHAKPNKEKIADHAMRRWLYLVKKLDTDDWDFLNWYNKKEGC